MKFIARLLAPYLWEEIRPKIEKYLRNYAYSVVTARHATEVLADELGYTIVIDADTGEASVVKN